MNLNLIKCLKLTILWNVSLLVRHVTDKGKEIVQVYAIMTTWLSPL